MTNGSILNCKRCGKVFRKQRSDCCPECALAEEEQFKQLYNTLHDSEATGGLTVNELSSRTGVSALEIERLFWEGRFSTAANFLKLPCHGCGVMMTGNQRRGRYCMACAEATAQKAGIDVKSRSDVEKISPQERLAKDYEELIKKNKDASSRDGEQRQFGSYRRNRF